MLNDKKKCEKCGRELPLNNFIKVFGKNYSNICKVCHGKNLTEIKFENKLKSGEISNEDFIVIRRNYKVIQTDRVLRKSKSGINHIARDEKFVKLLDYKECWISNYGRLIVKDETEKYRLLKPKQIRATGELTYTIYKNVYFKTKKQWGYKKKTVFAKDLVIQTFIVNFDIKNNTHCWHKDNNVKDNYYKNLYPVTELQYQEIKNICDREGTVSEAEIMKIVNSKDYKQTDWKQWQYVSTYNSKGYLGTDDVDYKSDAWIRWINMMQRCYNSKIHKYKPYYRNVKVCEEWYNFSNFKIWYDEHFVLGTKVDLDKDLVSNGGNIYSPESCAFITHFLNTVFENRGMKNNIVKNKSKKYSASMSILNKNMIIGEFETEKEAINALFQYKKKYITDIAEKSRNKVPDYVYQAMLNWDVKNAA